MSRYDYERSKEIARQDEPFYALIMAAMRKADDYNLAHLKHTWPGVWDELRARHNGPGGRIEGDHDYAEIMAAREAAFGGDA